MSNKKIEDVIKDLEQNLESQKDIEYVKKVLAEFLEEYQTNIEKRMQILEESQKELEFKTEKIQAIIDKMEDEFFVDEEEEALSFEIACPYCNNVFETELNELKEEITCPECNNVIELDWDCDCEEDEEDSCSEGCSCCNHGCSEDEYDDDDDM